VLHIDSSAEYGGRDASLSLKDLVAFVERPPAQLHITKLSNPVQISENLLKRSRDYAISLSPSVLPATGPLITALVQSGVARYGAFKLLDAIGIYGTNGGTVETIPASKEDVFKSKALSLIEKRRLMKFLMFASGDFETPSSSSSDSILRGKEDVAFSEFLKGPEFGLSAELASAVSYALAQCSEESGECVITKVNYYFSSRLFSEPTLPALLRLRRYIRSSGRYGNSAFLVGHYGGAGELSQGFCR
jgi:RAB protein geranylgeranyltransferase component A